MASAQIKNLLEQNNYPGRGIVMGTGENGCAYMAYFIMGRSENSRNRIFEDTEGCIKTRAADPAKLTDPSLVIYTAVRTLNECTIVTNGDQTDTIFEYCSAGKSFEDALRSRTFEPDAPNYTPRISGVLRPIEGGFCYKLSILKSAGGDASSAQRFFYEYPQPIKGQGHFIHTYAGDGEPLPSFCTEPVPVCINGDIDAFGEGLWNALNKDNKVSLFVRTISPSGEENTRIYNKYTAV